MSGPSPKLSANLAVLARHAAVNTDPKAKVIRLYRHVQKEVPYILKQFQIEEPVAMVRANIKREFMKHGGVNVDPNIVNMLVFKGQMELDEALAQWKTRTHILRYVYDVRYQPHVARSKLEGVQESEEDRDDITKYFQKDARA